MSVFKWTPRKEKAALRLAQGYSQADTSEHVGVTQRTVERWCANLDFSMEVDRLSLMVGVASASERLRIIQQVIRQKVSQEGVETRRDILDWLKFAREETGSADAALASLFAAMESQASSAESATANSAGEAPVTPESTSGS